MGKTVSKVNEERKRIRFSKEFKLKAVRLLTDLPILKSGTKAGMKPPAVVAR